MGVPAVLSHGRWVMAWLLAGLLAAQPAVLMAQSAPAQKPVPAKGVSAEAGKELVAVLDFEAVGASKVEADAMTDRLREELLKSGRFTLVDRTQMKAVLDEQALQQTGCTSQECAVQVGKVLGVRKLVSGKITKLSDTQWLLSAQMVDVETSQTLRAESIRHQGDYFSMLDVGIVQLAAKLATPPGEKPDLARYLAEQQAAAGQVGVPSAAPAQPAAAPAAQAKEESHGIAWYWWVLGAVAIAGLASGGGSKSSGSSNSGTGSSGNSCSSNCQTVNFSW